MQKDKLIELVTRYGDATITYISPESKKHKYNVCTLDFDNEYIRTKSDKADETDDSVKLFCWDSDSYRLISHERVISVVPLGASLKEGRNG